MPISSPPELIAQIGAPAGRSPARGVVSRKASSNSFSMPETVADVVQREHDLTRLGCVHGPAREILIQPLGRLTRERQRLIVGTAQAGDDHAIVRDLRLPEERRAIVRASGEHEVDQRLRRRQRLSACSNCPRFGEIGMPCTRATRM